MIALVDCNSFFCSVEKVFHPGLEGRPVCVLSSNDGCIVALTPEAKSLGLRRGDPIFQKTDIVRRHNVALFSTNMMLYAAMSKGVTNILRKSISHVENYSIDESFCYLDGYERHYALDDLMRGIAEKIRLYTDIPVSVGIAPSKTLAKIGSKFAKKYSGYHGVCLIDNETKRRRALSMSPLGDIWGIGRRTLEKLEYLGVRTPLDFADKGEGWVRHHFHKPGYQTWLELNGTSCIDTTEIVKNKSITTSRSFGNMISSLPMLKSSIASFAASCANKLRAQRCCARDVSVFICSNRFRDDLPQYSNMTTERMLVATADTTEITQAAFRALARIYRSGIMYKKSGVILGGICDDSPIQTDLFDPVTDRRQRSALMRAIDGLNQRYGMKTVRLAVEGGEKETWNVRCEHRSHNYLTDINDILTIQI